MLRLILLFVIALAATNALADEGKDESGKWRERHVFEWRFDHDWRFEAFDRPRHRHRAPVPKGHLPPPGECRIWYDHLPPGHQPPPYKC